MIKTLMQAVKKLTNSNGVSAFCYSGQFKQHFFLPCILGHWMRTDEIGLIQVKEEGWTGFSRAGRAALRDLPRANPKGHSEEQPCQPEENPVYPNSFTWIYIIFKIRNSAPLFRQPLTNGS